MQRLTIGLAVGIGILGSALHRVHGEDAPSWKAATARAVITPDEPMYLAGFGDRVVPAQGTAQDLYAKALAMEDAAGARLVVVTLDLVDVPRALRHSVALHAATKHGLNPEGLLLNCSHTHCGPELRYDEDELAELEPERAARCRRYTKMLHEKVVGVVDQAVKNLAPAKLSYGHARCGFAMNRRLKSDLPDGDPYLNRPNPDGVVDHDVPVLKVERADGSLAAVAFGYACHNTSLRLLQYHGDYAGHAQAMLEAAHPGATALFVMGCGGDQNAYPRFRDEYSEQHGRALATAVEAALEAGPRPLSGRLRAAYGEAVLEYAELPTAERLKARMETGAEYQPKYRDSMLAWDRRRLRELERGTLAKSYPCPVQVIRFGDDLTLVAIGGETVVDYSLRLKRELGGPGKVWVAGYSNDVFTYLPSRRVLQEGGYEAERALTGSTFPIHPSPFSHQVEEQVLGAVEELLKATAAAEIRTTEVPAAMSGEWTVLDPRRELPGQSTQRELVGEVYRKIRERENHIKYMTTEEQLYGRQARFREFLDERLGDIHPQTPLNARVVGQLDGKDYRIEKVIYESRPKCYVTAALYLPTTGTGPFPGVLIPCGHTEEGKAFYMEQRVGILMAQHGIVALSYDPIGQGERAFMQGSPPGTRRYRSTYEHTLAGFGAWLVGRQPAADHIIDGVRSLDYLASRPEVDPKRLGCTGNSGGGMLTTYLMALDDRVAAAAPCCWLTKYANLLSQRGPQDAEQLITGHVGREFDLPDYVLARVPKPLMVGAGIKDTTFSIEAVRDLVQEGRRAARLVGERDAVKLVEADFPHGFSEPLREAAVEFMKRTLAGETITVDEPAEASLHADRDLWCTPHGSVLELPGARSPYDVHADEAVRLQAEREAFWRNTPRSQAVEQIRKMIGALLPSLRERPRIQLVKAGDYPTQDVLISGMRIDRDDHAALPALLFLPQKPGEPKSAVIFLHEGGKQFAVDEGVRIAREGKVVLAVDVRGTGELESVGTNLERPHDWSRGVFGPNLGEFLLAMALDRTFVGLQVDDIAASRDALDVFFQRHPIERVELLAVGRVGVAALHAAAIESERYDHLTLRRTLASWIDIVRSRTPHDQGANTVYGALTKYDLPDLVRSLPVDRVTVEAPYRPDEAAAEPRYADYLTYEQAMAGWIQVFDGQTAFGWRDAVLGRGPNHATLLEGTTTSTFSDFELRVRASADGELKIGDQKADIRRGWNTIRSEGRRGAITIEPGLVVDALFLKPTAIQRLMNGRSPAGWDRRDAALLPPERRAHWTFENGVVRAVGGPGALEYAPATGPNVFGDFLAQLVVRTRRNDTNGGFFFRNEPGKTLMGYEVQLHHRWYDAARGEHGCTTGGIDDRQQARAPTALDHVPCRITVVADGPHLATWVNGYQTADWTDTREPDPNPRRGLRTTPGTIQLQAHDPETDIEFHGVWLQELPP
jgi:dienelactone hydrolase